MAASDGFTLFCGGALGVCSVCIGLCSVGVAGWKNESD